MSRLRLAWEEARDVYRAARADHWRFWPSVREAWWGVRYVWETGGRPHMFNPNFTERAR